jgi:hypothetical protein
MPDHTLPLTIPTPYGPATFELTVGGDGTLTHVGLPLAGLPPSAFKLTYGKAAEEAAEHFSSLARILPARVAVARQVEEVPRELRDLTVKLAEYAPSSRGYFSDHPEWAGLYGFTPKRHRRVLRRILRRPTDGKLRRLATATTDYLIDWLPLAPHRTTELIYAVLGHFGTKRGRDFLLAQLGSPGRHPFTVAILRGLREHTDPVTYRGLREAYAGDRIGPLHIADYLRHMGRFAEESVPEHVAEVLDRHPYEPEAAARAWREFGLSDTATATRLRTAFERTDNYPALNDLLATANQFATEHAIDLTAMNRRLEHPEWVDLPPVNWPQQLEPAWRELVRSSPAEEVLDVVGKYLDRKEARLQRNAILQLRVFLQRADAPQRLSPALEASLRSALATRYDKVYVEVLNILGARPKLQLNDPVATLDAVLERSLNSRYRIVILTALRRVGDTQALQARAHRFYRDRIMAATNPARIRAISEWLPYLRKYLREATDLKPLLERRRSALESGGLNG